MATQTNKQGNKQTHQKVAILNTHNIRYINNRTVRTENKENKTLLLVMLLVFQGHCPPAPSVMVRGRRAGCASGRGTFFVQLCEGLLSVDSSSPSGVAQWLACWAQNPKVRGSKPRPAMWYWLRCLFRTRAMARIAPKSAAALAQLVKHTLRTRMILGSLSIRGWFGMLRANDQSR